MRPIAVLRPPPGNAATMAAIAAAGGTAIALPLFEIAPLAWTPPDPRDLHALALTSANAVRMAGPGLTALAALPVWTVGDATTAAARAHGLTVVHTGTDGAEAMFAAMAGAGIARVLWLAGEDRRPLPDPAPPRVTVVETYRAAPLPFDPEALPDGAVLMVHSPRAASRLATVPPARRADHPVIAISPAAAAALGPGWAVIDTAAAPTDAAMVAAAIDRARLPPDKPGR